MLGNTLYLPLAAACQARMCLNWAETLAKTLAVRLTGTEPWAHAMLCRLVLWETGFMELNGAAQGQQGTLDSGECMWVGQDQRICSSCQLQDGLLNIFNWWPATKSAGLKGLASERQGCFGSLFFCTRASDTVAVPDHPGARTSGLRGGQRVPCSSFQVLICSTFLRISGFLSYNRLTELYISLSLYVYTYINVYV